MCWSSGVLPANGEHGCKETAVPMSVSYKRFGGLSFGKEARADGQSNAEVASGELQSDVV